MVKPTMPHKHTHACMILKLKCRPQPVLCARPAQKKKKTFTFYPFLFYGVNPPSTTREKCDDCET